MTLDVDWHALCAAVEEMGYVLFPKDMMVEFANKHKEWEEKERLIEDYIADAKRLEAERAASAAMMVNQCVSCGNEMPEGDMLCKTCLSKLVCPHCGEALA